MRQKEILGSHGAHAHQAIEANKLVTSGRVRPLLSQTMSFEDVPEAHQMMLENKHLGKIAILVGAENEDEGRNEDGPRAIRA